MCFSTVVKITYYYCYAPDCTASTGRFSEVQKDCYHQHNGLIISLPVEDCAYCANGFREVPGNPSVERLVGVQLCDQHEAETLMPDQDEWNLDTARLEAQGFCDAANEESERMGDGISRPWNQHELDPGHFDEETCLEAHVIEEEYLQDDFGSGWVG